MDMEKTPQYSWPLSKLGQCTRNKVLPLCSFMCVPLDSMALFIFDWLVNRLLFLNISPLLFVSQKKDCAKICVVRIYNAKRSSSGKVRPKPNDMQVFWLMLIALLQTFPNLSVV